MANDSEWVEDVRRWYHGSSTLTSYGNDTSESDLGDHALGYQAALPVLQAHHWPDAPVIKAASAGADV